MTVHLSARSDVYSFGVVLLELLTGRKYIDKSRASREQSLVDWARPKLNDKRRLLQIIDPKLEGQYSVRAAHKACGLAYYCLSQNPKARPLTSDVVETLEPLQGGGGSDGAVVHVGGLPDYRVHRRLTQKRPLQGHSQSQVLPRCPGMQGEVIAASAVSGSATAAIGSVVHCEVFRCVNLIRMFAACKAL